MSGTERSPEALRAAIERLDRMVGSFEAEPDARIRERVLELLEAVDAVHRPLVWHVGEAIWRAEPDLFGSLLDDPVGGVLFELYGLASPSRRGSEQPDVAGYVGLDDLIRSLPPVFAWRRAASVSEVPEGGLLARSVDAVALLLTRAGDSVRAYLDACPGTPLGLGGGGLGGGALVCPWHGCRFDLATGDRDGGGAGLEPVPVDLAGDEVRVGLRTKRSAA